MTDKAAKLLRSVTAKQRERLQSAIDRLKAGDDRGLDVKPLKGHKDVYRARIGSYRIIFSRRQGVFKQITVLKRDDHTYRDF